MKKNKNSPLRGDAKDHLANERTFLAWIRTSIGLMAFGFVIERFGLFIQKLEILTGEPSPERFLSLHGSSSIFGLSLVVFGMLICLFSFISYRKVRKQIEDNIYQPFNFLSVAITLFVVTVAILLIFSVVNLDFKI